MEVRTNEKFTKDEQGKFKHDKTIENYTRFNNQLDLEFNACYETLEKYTNKAFKTDSKYKWIRLIQEKEKDKYYNKLVRKLNAEYLKAIK